MVRDLHFGIEIVPVETVREADGLAHEQSQRLAGTRRTRGGTALYQASPEPMARDGETRR
jgi:pantothenate synthetase